MSPARIPAARLLSVLPLAITFATNHGRAAEVHIRMDGCDRMLNLMTTWAEGYRHVKPNVFVEISGSSGGGDGFAALQHNYKDIIGACHQITPEWRAKIKAAARDSETK